MLHVSRKMIMWKAKNIFDEKSEDPAIKDSFVASRGWCEKFMPRHRFSLRRKTTTAQKDPAYIVPGGCTKYIQTPDVMWNKPFKGEIQEFCNDWLASGKHKYTNTNKKPVPRRLIVDWVIKSWQAIPAETVAHSMKACSLSLPVYGTKDG